MRVATYNIKCLKMSNPQSVVSLLRDNDVDVCGLQECPGKWKLDALVRDTSYRSVFLGPYHSYGPGLVYRRDKFTLVESKLHMLKDGRNKKSALEVTLRDNGVGGVTSFVVTHLDHKTEDQRLLEVEQLLRCKLPPQHVLLADLNSLKRIDYTDEAWKAITDVRRSNGWELPSTSVIERLLNEAGYVDTVPVSGPTCHFNTRVDYILLSSGMKATATPHKANVQENQSDHTIVVITLT